MTSSVLVLLDYDDTLFPSSFLIETCSKGLASRDGCASEHERIFCQAVLDATSDFLRLDNEAVQLIEGILDPLRRINFVIKVVIISNGDSLWVRSSIKGLLPKLHESIERNKIDVISSRDAYANEYPENVMQWKIQSFEDEVLKVLFESQPTTSSGFFKSSDDSNTMSSSDEINVRAQPLARALYSNRYSNAMFENEQLKMDTSSSKEQLLEQRESPIKKCARFSNAAELKMLPANVQTFGEHGSIRADGVLVISIGDGFHERSASLALCKIDGVRVLSLKLLNALCPDELCKELKFLGENLGFIFDLGSSLSTRDQALDLVVVRTAESLLGIVHYERDGYGDNEGVSATKAENISSASSHQAVSSSPTHSRSHSPLVLQAISVKDDPDKIEIQMQALHLVSDAFSESENKVANHGITEIVSTGSGADMVDIDIDDNASGSFRFNNHPL